MGTPATLRLFFALWPDATLRRVLARSTRAWVRAAGGRPVPLDNLHLTLAFLGAVPAGQLDAVRSAGRGVASPSFELVLDRMGFFARARTLWLGPSAVSGELGMLEQTLWQGLTAAGWRRQERVFTPHLTLARKAHAVRDAKPVKPVVWPVTSFSLIESVTGKRGAVYRELARWPLAQG